MTDHGFNETTPILDFGATDGSMSYESKTRVRFAWPVYACDIVCTLPKEAPLNLFQEHVLRVLHAQASAQPHDIARILCLDEQIIIKVLRELESQGWLGKHNMLTDEAEKYLVTEEETISISGTIFLDASSNKMRFVHPIFVRRELESRCVEVSTTRDKSNRFNRFEIKTGTAGKPRTHAIKVSTKVSRPFKPKDSQIIEALKESARLTARHKELCEDYMLDLVTGPIRGVSLNTSEPRPHYLYTYAFVPQGEMYWLVCDPFGRGASLTYRRHAQASQELKQFCESSLQNMREHIASGDVDSIRNDALAKLYDKLTQENNTLTRKEVTSRIQLHPELADRLGTWFFGGQSVGEAWACLEQLLAISIQDITSEERIDTVLQSLPQSPQSSAPMILGSAKQMGFTTSASTESWLRQATRARIKGALKDGNTTMSAVLSAALLMHAKQSDSPLHQLALVHTDFIDKLSEFNDLRNQELHESAQVRDSSRAYEMTRLVLDCVHVLLLRHLPLLKDDNNTTALRDELDRMQCHRQARLEAMAYLTQHESLNAEERLHLENLLAELGTPLMRFTADDDMEHALAAQAIRHSYKLAEYCMRRLCETRTQRTQVLLDAVDRDANAEQLRQLHERSGGIGDIDMFGRAHPERLMRQLRRPRPQGLSAYVWKNLLDASVERGHPLWEILKKEPYFMFFINNIAASRRHGDRPVAPGSEAHRIAQTVRDILTLTLNTLSKDHTPS